MLKQRCVYFLLLYCLLSCGVASADERHLRTVVSVYDGDTVRFGNGQRARLLGISAPEIKSQYRAGEVGGIAARDWLKAKVVGKKVLVEYDKQRYDKYQRALVHIFLADGEHINVAMVASGLAFSLIIPPNLHYAEGVILAEKTAERHRLGIWAAAHYQPKSLKTLLNGRQGTGWQRYLLTAKAYKRSQKYSRLIVSDKVDIRIPNAFLTTFPNLDGYLYQTLEVRGWVSRRKGHYSILVRHPSAIIVH